MTVANLQAEETIEVTLSPVTRMDLIKYSGASGDYNPIHTVDEDAKKAGLPAVIAHGMWTMGNLTKLFTPFYEEGFVEDYSIRFGGMVFVGDVVTLKANVQEKREDSIHFEVEALNQKEKTVLKGNVKFKLY